MGRKGGRKQREKEGKEEGRNRYGDVKALIVVKKK